MFIFFYVFRSWQIIVFPPRQVSFIRITGTHNTANEVFHCVHFECPCDSEVLNRYLEHENISRQQLNLAKQMPNSQLLQSMSVKSSRTMATINDVSSVIFSSNTSTHNSNSTLNSNITSSSYTGDVTNIENNTTIDDMGAILNSSSTSSSTNQLNMQS